MGGLKKADSWAEAYAKANSLLLVVITYPSMSVKFTITIPKEGLTTSSESYLSGAYHSSNSYYALAVATINTLSVSFYHNSVDKSTSVSYVVYYD